MTNQPTSEPATTFCTICGLDDDKAHHTPGDCIFGLRAALVRQKKAASLLSFEVSTRYLAIIENLALRPNVGIPYSIMMPPHPHAPPGEMPVIQVHHYQVRGVFTAIWKAFAEAGDWSPLKEQETQIRKQRELLTVCIDLISDVFTERFATDCPRGFLEDLQLIEDLATPLGVPLPDLANWKSPPR